jgi:hypothetical protein
MIASYGDSLTFGSIAGPAGELTRLSVPPVRRAQELLGTSALCVDLQPSGRHRLRMLWLACRCMPFGPFAEHVKTTAASRW